MSDENKGGPSTPKSDVSATAPLLEAKGAPFPRGVVKPAIQTWGSCNNADDLLRDLQRCIDEAKQDTPSSSIIVETLINNLDAFHGHYGQQMRNPNNLPGSFLKKSRPQIEFLLKKIDTYIHALREDKKKHETSVSRPMFVDGETRQKDLSDRITALHLLAFSAPESKEKYSAKTTIYNVDVMDSPIAQQAAFNKDMLSLWGKPDFEGMDYNRLHDLVSQIHALRWQSRRDNSLLWVFAGLTITVVLAGSAKIANISQQPIASDILYTATALVAIATLYMMYSMYSTRRSLNDVPATATALIKAEEQQKGEGQRSNLAPGSSSVTK